MRKMLTIFMLRVERMMVHEQNIWRAGAREPKAAS